MIQDRIIQFIDYKGISKYKFYKTTGLSNGFLDKNGSIGADKCEIIYSHFPELNLEWLLTGDGNMLRDSVDVKVNYKRNLIPLYNDVATIGGVVDNVANIDAVSHTTEYIDSGDWFPGATAAIRHYGSSMIEYPSGSILALKKVEDIRLLVWGRNYCIETTEYRITKILNKSKEKDFLMGYSSNVETYHNGNLIHEPIDIPTESIRAIYQVLGCVTKEYSNGVVEIKK